MKVKMTADSKRCLTLAEAPIANRIITEMKEDTSTAEEYIKFAISAVGDHTETVYKAEAQIAKNSRSWNNYGNDTEHLDIWIDAEARTMEGFIIIGAYLTDIWQISSDNEEEMSAHMFVRRFIEEK